MSGAQLQSSDTLNVTNIAADTCREILSAASALNAVKTHFTGLFLDDEARRSARGIVRNTLRLEAALYLENALHLACGRGGEEIPRQHLIYCVGLIEQIDQDELLLRLLNWVFRHLLPGGRFILGSFHETNPDRRL